MTTRISPNDVTKANKELLFNLASNDESWEGYLDVMAQHTNRDRRRLADGTYDSLDNLNALNCASLASIRDEVVRGDVREAMTAREWKRLYPDAAPAEGAPRAAVVKASSTGKNVWADYVYPASSMNGLPDKRFHNIPEHVDLKDDVDAACWASAVSDLKVYRNRMTEDGKRVFEDGRPVRDPEPVSYDELSADVAHVVRSHFGIERPDGALAPTSPVAAGIVSNADELKAYCDQLKSDATALTRQISKAFDKARNDLIGIDLDSPAQERSEERPVPVSRIASESVTAPPSAVMPPVPSPRENAPAHVSEPYTPVGKSPMETAQAAHAAASRDVAQGGSSGMAIQP